MGGIKTRARRMLNMSEKLRFIPTITEYYTLSLPKIFNNPRKVVYNSVKFAKNYLKN
jgi:hypothetical protein